MTTTIISSIVKNYESDRVRSFNVSVAYDKYGTFEVAVYEDKEGQDTVRNIEKFELYDKAAAIRKHGRLVAKYSTQSI